MSYRDILQAADAHFRATLSEQRENLRCGRGCTGCCYGLFEIGAADVTVVAKGLEALAPSVREEVTRRAEMMMVETRHPDLRSATKKEKKEFFHRTAAMPCPALEASSGSCLIYENRPLMCRTFGLPVRDGATYLGEECELNFTTASQGEKERAAWDLQREDAVGADDQYTVAEAIVLAARVR